MVVVSIVFSSQCFGNIDCNSYPSVAEAAAVQGPKQSTKATLHSDPLIYWGFIGIMDKEVETSMGYIENDL